MTKETPELIVETLERGVASDLYWSGEWSKPIWNETRGYILIRKASEVKKLKQA